MQLQALAETHQQKLSVFDQKCILAAASLTSKEAELTAMRQVLSKDVGANHATS